MNRFTRRRFKKEQRILLKQQKIETKRFFKIGRIEIKLAKVKYINNQEGFEKFLHTHREAMRDLKMKHDKEWTALCKKYEGSVSSRNGKKREKMYVKEEMFGKQNKKVKVIKCENNYRWFSDKGCRISFLDVGQGDCIVLENCGKVVIIDFGKYEDTTKDFLRNSFIQMRKTHSKRKRREISQLIITHVDGDHIAGFDKVLNKFPCEYVLMSDMGQNTEQYAQVIDSLQRKQLDTTLRVLSAEEGRVKKGKYDFEVGKMKFRVLGPTQKHNTPNDDSIILLMEYKGKKVLFMGDADEAAEQDLIAFCKEKHIDIHSDILKVGHHGSSTSSNSFLLDKVKPKYAVISVGKGNDYGHPHDAALKRLKSYVPASNILRTDKLGLISATIDRHGRKISFENGKMPVMPKRKTENEKRVG